MKILILCTGNSCRSQMAEGFLKSLAPRLEVYSAGTEPAAKVHPLAIKVMQEIGIDLSQNQPKSVDQFLDHDFDYVITVCDHARETCPVFLGKVKQRIHIGFEDPAAFQGPEAEALQVYRRVRDEITTAFAQWYTKQFQQAKNND